MSEKVIDVLDAEPRWHRIAQPIGKAAFAATGALFGAAIALNASPYHTNVSGVDVEVGVTTKPGVAVETTAGQLEFPNVTDLPVGLEITPVVNLGAVQSIVNNTPKFTQELQDAAKEEIRPAIEHFALNGAMGAALGTMVAALAGNALFGHTRREKRIAALSAVLALGMTAGAGAITYNEDWMRDYNVTMLLADVNGVPGDIEQLNQMDITAGRKQVNAVSALKELLLTPVQEKEQPDEAFAIMTISDVHLREVYSSLPDIIEENGVKLIINTGDETLFGAVPELTDSYINAIANVTKTTPMIWVKGNHDSNDVAEKMATIPGVIVLDESYVDVYGLRVAGLGDPFEYSDGEVLGSDKTDGEEVTYTKDAISDLPDDASFDIFATHTPISAQAAASALGKAVRMTDAGHIHTQKLKQNGVIELTEGTTGMNGLADVGTSQTQMQFSILKVASDCQFYSVERYALSDPTLRSTTNSSPYGSDASISVQYLHPQSIASRTCSAKTGIGDPVEWRVGDYSDDWYGQTDESGKSK